MTIYVITKTKEMSDDVETCIIDDLEAAVNYCIKRSSYHLKN